MGEGGKQVVGLSFAENFLLSGSAAVIAKTAAAPIERVKLLIQNQDEMIKQGRLERPYKGVVDCTLHTFKTEGSHLSSPTICFRNPSILAWKCTELFALLPYTSAQFCLQG